MQKRLTYTIREAATILGISSTLAYELAKSEGALGGVSVIHLGKRMVVPREPLDRLLCIGA